MNDTISRAAALDAILKKPAWHNSDGSYYHSSDIKDALEGLPSAQPEYTENEEKVLITMFTMVKNILDLQDGYMDIDYTTFGHNELFDLSEKLGIDY